MGKQRGHRWQATVDWIIRARIFLLALATLLTLLFAGPASQLQLDESIESFFSINDPFRMAYQTSRKAFGGDEFVMIGFVEEDPTSTDSLNRIRELSTKLSAVEGVNSQSTQNLDSTLRNPNASGLMRLGMRFPSTRKSLLDLSRRMLIGDDNKTCAIILRLTPLDKTNRPRTATFGEIRAITSAFNPDAVVAGEPLQVHDMFRYVEQDGWVLGFASSALLMLIILILFRNLRWVILPIVVIHITLLITRGSLYLSGMQLSMVSSMLTSLITIIGIATVMHLIVTYRRKRSSTDRFSAFKTSMIELGAPVFWTCLTTAIGFASLMTSNIVPVSSFGLMTALGTLVVPVVCVLILPGGALIGNFQADPSPPPAENQLVVSLVGLARWCLRSSKQILTVTFLLILIFTAGLFRLSVETDFSKNFRKSSPIIHALEFFETRLGGVGSWEVGFPAPTELNEEYLVKIRELTEDLREIHLDNGAELTKVVSLTDGLDLVPRLPVSDDTERRGLFRGLPKFRSPTLAERQDLLDELQPELLSSLYNPDEKRMRIMLRALEQQPAEIKLKLIEAVETTARKHFPKAQATGLYVLLANLISSLLNDQAVSFSLAAVGVSLTMAIAFRSLWVGIISIVPNVLPIMIVIGGMGWLNIPINIGTAMIACVSMGLTVDSTIHYLTSYYRSRKSGSDHVEAIQSAHGSVGLALVLANIALVLGFSVLALSNFIPLVYFGSLVSIAMLGGLICNLFLLPSLLAPLKNAFPITRPA